MLEHAGFSRVQTILASGNVVFSYPKTNPNTIEKKIEMLVEKKFGHRVDTIVRTMADMQDVFYREPFKKIKTTKDTRLYVTFRTGKARGELRLPYTSPEKDFHILRATDSEVFSVLVLSPERDTTDVMKVLEKEYGKRITTRNWNTIQKIALASTFFKGEA